MVDVPAEHLVSLTEAARRLGCSAPYLFEQARISAAFPEPVAVLGRSRVFDMRQVVEWWENRPRSRG